MTVTEKSPPGQPGGLFLFAVVGKKRDNDPGNAKDQTEKAKAYIKRAYIGNPKPAGHVKQDQQDAQKNQCGAL